MNSEVQKAIDEIESPIIRMFLGNLVMESDNIEEAIFLKLLISSQHDNKPTFHSNLKELYSILRKIDSSLPKYHSINDITQQLGLELYQYIRSLYNLIEENSTIILEHKVITSRYNDIIDEIKRDSSLYDACHTAVKRLLARNKAIPKDLNRLALNIYAGNIARPEVRNIDKFISDSIVTITMWTLKVFLKIVPTAREKNTQSKIQPASGLIDSYVDNNYTFDTANKLWGKRQKAFKKDMSAFARVLASEMSTELDDTISKYTEK